MEITFLGTGSAFDEDHLNNSSLLVSKKTKLLLDCGGTTPFQLWKINKDPNFLDAVYISHSHADHYFDLPSLFSRMWIDGRKKPLILICQRGLKKKIQQLVELGYKGFMKKYNIKIDFKEINRTIKFNDLNMSVALTEHSVDNYAIKVESEGKTVCYSGDGMFTKQTEELYKDCDLLIHEAFLYDKIVDGHTYITGLVKMAEENNVACLALTHMSRNLRKKGFKIPKSKVKIIIPKNFNKIKI